MQKEVINHQDTSKSYTRKYVYDGGNVLFEYDSSNLIAEYTFSPSTSDDILAVNVTNDGVAANLATAAGSYFYLKDRIGSVTEVTNADGTILQKYDYSSFGKIYAVMDGAGSDITANPVLKTTYTYTGREYEEESGLFYYRARYYDPGIGRFLQKDPDPGSLSLPSTVSNRYTYVGNLPTALTDPTGLSYVSDRLGVDIDLNAAGHRFIEDVGAAVDRVIKSDGFKKLFVLAVAFVAGPWVAALLGLSGAAAVGVSMLVGGAIGGLGYNAFGVGTFEEGFALGALAGGLGSYFLSPSNNLAFGAGKNVASGMCAGFGMAFVCGGVSDSSGEWFFEHWVFPDGIIPDGSYFFHLWENSPLDLVKPALPMAKYKKIQFEEEQYKYCDNKQSNKGSLAEAKI